AMTASFLMPVGPTPVNSAPSVVTTPTEVSPKPLTCATLVIAVPPSNVTRWKVAVPLSEQAPPPSASRTHNNQPPSPMAVYLAPHGSSESVVPTSEEVDALD